MALSKEKFNKYLKIENNVVYAKTKARIYLDKTEYTKMNDIVNIETGDDENDEYDIAQNIVEIPGFFTIRFYKDDEIIDSITFYLPYPIYIFKGENFTEKTTFLDIWYEENDPIFYAKFEKNEVNIDILNSLLDNGVKYLSNDMFLLVLSIWKQLFKVMNVPFHHIELAISQLYGKFEDGEFKPIRLTKDQRYCKECALNTKKSAHLFNKTLGFMYGYSNDALFTSVVSPKKNRNKESSYFEKMIAHTIFSDE
jgi:hypothetical protein